MNCDVQNDKAFLQSDFQNSIYLFLFFFFYFVTCKNVNKINFYRRFICIWLIMDVTKYFNKDSLDFDTIIFLGISSF